MLKILKMTFEYKNGDSKIFSFIEKGVFTLFSQRSKVGKSTFINFIYLLLGSDSVFKNCIKEKKNSFNERGLILVSLMVELDGQIMKNEVEIDEEFLFSAFVQKKEAWGIIKDKKKKPTIFKRIIKKNTPDLEAIKFHGNDSTPVKADIYTVNSFFHGLNSGDKLFTSSSNAWVSELLKNIYSYKIDDQKIMQYTKYHYYNHLLTLSKKAINQIKTLQTEEMNIKSQSELIMSQNKESALFEQLTNKVRTKEKLTLRQESIAASNIEKKGIDYKRLIESIEASNLQKEHKEIIMKEVAEDYFKEDYINEYNSMIRDSIEKIQKRIKQLNNEIQELKIQIRGTAFLAWENFRIPQIKEEIEEIQEGNSSLDLKSIERNKQKAYEKIKSKEETSYMAKKYNELMREFGINLLMGNAIDFNTQNFEFIFEDMGVANTTYKSFNNLITIILFAERSLDFTENNKIYTPSIISLNSMLNDPTDSDKMLISNNASKIIAKLEEVSKKTGTIFVFQDKTNLLGEYSKNINIQEEEVFLKKEFLLSEEATH